jgi:hypothetical protein
MRTYLNILFLVCIGIVSWCRPLLGQQILWERSFHLRTEQFFSVCSSGDGQILAGGETFAYGINVPGNTAFMGSALFKISPEGDSIWIKKMPYLGSIKNLVPTGTGLIWAVFQVTEPFQPTNNKYYPAVTLLANDSAILINKSFPELNTFELADSYSTLDGGLILFGTKSPSLFPGYTSDFYAMKLSALGNLEWSRAYNPGPTNSFCQAGQVEPMANGNFLVSGSMGSWIVSFEIDPVAGTDTNFVQWYQADGNFLIKNGSVRQSINNSRIVTGSIQNSSSQFYISKYDSAGFRIFGGASLLGSVPPFTNKDGSCIILTAIDVNTRFLSRLNSDSTDYWKVQLVTSIPGRKFFYDLLYSENDNGYLVGTNTRTGYSDDFYIAKFSGIGTPFDPTGIKQPHLVKNDALPFPNPCLESFRFKKEFQKGEVYLFSLAGKRVLSQQSLHKDQALDVSMLAAGTYLYRAVLDGRPHWGKVLKQ